MYNLDKMVEQRISLGTPELDQIIDGGVPVGKQVLLAGIPGAGKTLLGFQFLYLNAKKGIKGLFIALEQSRDELVSDAKKAFSEYTDIDQVIATGGFDVLDVDALSTMVNASDYYDTGQKVQQGWSLSTTKRDRIINNLFRDFDRNFVRILRDRGVKIIVIDNITVIRNMITTEFEYRSFITGLSTILKAYTMASLLVREISESERDGLVFEADMFGFDGIIFLYSYVNDNVRVPCVEVLKMRGTKHSFFTIPYVIGPSGIKLLKAGEKIQDVWR